MKYLIRKDTFQNKPYILCKENPIDGGFHKHGATYTLRGLQSRVEQLNLDNISFENSELEDEVNTEIVKLEVVAEAKKISHSQ